MATEADIPVPVCETRGEQVAHFVDNIIKISVSKLPLEKQTQDDKYSELPTVEGENFLRPPSTGEVHGEVYSVSPDLSKVTEKPYQTVEDGTKLSDQPVELAAEEIQQNVEESNSTEIVTSDPDADDARVVTQLSKDTSIDHHGTDESYTENIALTKEILQETSLPSEETESHAPCISEVEELNVQVKTTDNKSADEKPTEEALSCNLTNKVSEEGESDQNTVTSEKEALAIERSAEDNSNTAAEEGSQENSTSTETITTLEASNSDELQSKSDLNSSLSKEEETAVQKGDRSVTTSEGYGVPLEKTLSESHGDVECQSKTLEDAAADHSDPKLTEKSEESSPVQVEDSQIENDEHLEVESERLPLTEVLEGGTNDNVPAATDNVKDEDEDHKGAELSENEPSTTRTLVKEDRQIEIPAESLLVAPENIEVSNLGQEKSIEGPPEEQSTNATLHGNTIEAEEAIIDAVDQQKECFESFPPIVSSSPEEGSMNAVLQEATSDHTDEKIIDEDGKHKEVLENLSIGDVSNVTEKPEHTVEDGTDTLLLSPKLDDQPVDFAPNEETCVEEIQQNVEESNRTEKDGDRDVVPEQCDTDSPVMKVGDTLDDPDTDDARVVTQLSKDTSSDHHGTYDTFTENIALAKEILQDTSLPSEETESHTPCISESEELNVQVKTTDNKSADEKPREEDMSCNLTSEVSKEGESDQNKVTPEETLVNERSVENNFNIAAGEVSQENSTSTETITTIETSNRDELQSKSDLNSSFSKEEETTVQKGDRSVTTSEDSGVLLENTFCDSHGDVECQSKTLEDAATDHSDPKLTEKSEESSLVQVDDSQIECDEQLEEESEKLPLTARGTNDNIPAATDNVRDEDEDHKGVELSENEPSTTCTSVKEDRQIENPAESLLVAPENIEVSNLSQEKSIEAPPEEQSANATLHGNTIEVEEATIDAVDRQKESFESFPPIVSSSPEEGSMNAVLQEVASDHTDRNIDEVDKHKEVLENVSIGEAHSEINNVSPDVSKDTEKPDQTMKDGSDTLLISPKLDDQPVEFAANEETSVEEIQQNAEESSSTEKYGDRGVVPEQCSTDSSVETSEIKVGDTLDDPDMDDARVVTQLSNDTSSDHLGTNDSFTEHIALTEEILQETNLPSEETESHTPCISEDEGLNVHVKTTDKNSGDEKTTEEGMSCNLTSEVFKGESDQNERTSDQEGLANERNVEDSFNIAAEEVSQEYNTSTETITSLETSNSEESKSDLNSSFSKEEETTLQKGDRSLTTSEDSGILLENTLSDSHGDVECQSETLEDDATNHSNPKLAEKSEERSLIQVDDSQIKRDEQLEEESERQPLTEALTGDTNDNVPATMVHAKDEDEDLKEDEVSESGQSTRCTSVKEDVQIENPAESLHEAPENIEVSNLCQENNIKGPLEEQSTNANLLGTTIEAEEATVDAVDRQKESLEIPPIVSSSPEERSINEVLQEVTSDQTDEKIIDEVDKQKEVLENLTTTVTIEDTEGNLLIKLDSSENKNEEDLGKESEKTPLPLPLEREISDESKFLHEARFEDGEPKETEFCDNEISTESRTENTEDSLHVTSEDTNAPDLGQETEKTSAIEEQNLSTHPQVILDEKSDCGTVDAAEEKEETLENLPTIVPNEKTGENSSIRDDRQKMENEEHLEKEIDQLSLIKDRTGNVNNDEAIVKDEIKIEDEDPSGAELFEMDKNTESVSLPEEVQSEKPVESLHAAPEDVKPSDFGQHTEATGMLEEQIPAKNSQGMSTDETDVEVIDAANTNEETQELQNGSNEESSKDLLVEVDASETKHETNLEEETERPSLTEASKEGPNDEESTILLEPKTGDECLSNVELPNDEKSTDSTTPKKENLQDATQDHKTSTPSSDIETTGSLEEQSLAENSQEIISNKIINAADEKELALENVATEIPHEHIEENSAAQVDCFEREHEERLEKDNQYSSLIEASIEETNVRESTNIDELENRDEDSIKPELENEENTESTSVKEETDVEKPVESLQVKPEDIKQHDSSLDINNSIEEQIPTTDPREISVDNTEGESVDAADTNEESLEVKDITKNIPDCDKEDNVPIEEVGSQKPSIEASEGNPNDEQSTKITEGGLIKEEGSIESLQVAAQDIDTPPLGRDRKTSSLDEQSQQSPIITPEGIMDDNKEDIADNATGLEDEPPKDKQNIANTTLYEDKEENLQVQEDCSRLEQNEDLGNDSENTPCTEAPIVYSTESSPVKEEEDVEKSIEEQILTADPQETCDKTQEKTVDADNEKNDVVVNASNGDSEDNSPIEVDGSQKPSSEGVPAEKINDDEPTTTHEANFANENAVKDDLFEDEKKIECDLVKEEVYIESLQVADEDIKDTSSSQDREASHLEEQAPTTDSHITTGDHKDAKTLDPNDPEEETLEDKNYATTLFEDTKEDSLNQVDGSLLEQKEHSEKDGESTPFTDAPKDDTTESPLVREVAQVEDPIDSSQVATEDITAFAPCQDTGRSSTVEQILDPEDISSNKITVKIIDATGEETQEAQDIAKSVPHEDDSPDEKNVEATLIREDVSIELPQVAADDIKEPYLSEARETISQEEQILTANPRGPVDDNGENKTIDPIVFQKETPKDVVPKEIESIDVKATPIELKVEEGYLKDHQEKSSNSTAEKTPCAEDLDVNEDVIEHIPEVSNYKQHESSITEMSEEHMNEHVSDSTSLKSEVLEKNNDQVVGEANSFGDKTDSEEIEVQNDGSIAVPTIETLAETDPKGCTEAVVQVPNEEKEAELIKQEAEVDQKNIKETLLNNASEDVSESKEVNGEEKIDSNNCEEISGSSNSVASEEVSTSNVALKEDSTSNSSQEPRRETTEEAETEEAQKQESELQVSELIHDSSEKIERDAQSVNEEVQKLKEVPLPAPEENIIKTTDCKESDIVEGATSNEYIDHLEQDDTTKSFSDGKNPTEEEQEETVANDVLPVSPIETPGVDHSTTERELTSNEEPCIGKTATEESIIKTTDCKESDIVEGATSNDYIDHLEQDDTTKSFSDGKNPTEKEQEETVAKDVLPVSPIENAGVDHSTTERELTSSEEPCIVKTAAGDDEEIKIEKDNNDEKEACEEKISDISSAAPDMIEARETGVAKFTNNFNNIVDTAEGTVINENTSAEGILVDKRSVTDFETKNDDEAPETKETTPPSAEGQDVGSANVEENSNYTGSLTEEKSDSNEVAFAPGENKSGYESNNRVLESIAQDQSCDIISETGEENLKAEAEIKSDKSVAENIFEQEETAREKEIMKDDISSKKEQLPISKAEDEDIKDYDQGSCAEEVITDSHQEDEVKQEQENNKETVEFIKDGNEIETVSKVSEEADDKAPEDLEEKILTNEAIDRILHQEEQAKSIEEPTTKIDTEKAQELDIASVKTDTRDSNEEGVQIAIIPGKESEEHNKKDKICSSDEVQAKDEENVTLSEGKSEEEAKEADTWIKPNEDEDKEAYVEAKKIDFASQTKYISECAVSDGAQYTPEDNENSTTKNKFSEEDYPSKSTEFEVSSASEDIALTEQASEATFVTTEVQEAKAGIDLGAAVPKATGLENPVVEEENDKGAAMADTSTPVEAPVVSTSKIIPECTVGTPLEAEDQQTKLHDLPEELNIRDSEVKMAEKDDSVNLQCVRDKSEDVQELSKESFEVSNNENPVEGDPEEKIETSEGQETKSIQNAPVSETLKHETEEQQLGSDTEDVHEKHKLNSIPNQLESSYGTETEKVLESSILQSSVEDTAQHDKEEGSQQIDSPPFLPQAHCSDIKTSEKDLLGHVAGLDSVDVTEPEASPLPLKDKHVVLEADDTRKLNPENLGGDKTISTEYSQGEYEIMKPSKVEHEEAECGNEEGTDQEREGKPESKETGKASLSDHLQVSMRERSQMADHSATEKEPTSHTEDLHAENSDEAEHENLKTDEEKDDEEESHEQRRSDLSSEAPVIVEMADADVKVAHKKSHNILSGVGSKVKHSIAKVKKAITGKSSHPKPPSPKKVIN